MIVWKGLPLDLAAEDLVALARLLHKARAQAVVVVGEASGALAFLLRDMTNGTPVLASPAPPGQGLVEDTSGARPSALAAEALAAGRAVVCLAGLPLADAFVWAAALSHPGSLVIVLGPRPDDRAVPDLHRVACERARDEERRMPGAALVARRVAAREVTMPPPDLVRRPMPKRPLRSVFLGDLHYVSLYRAGVAQGMTLLGAWHRAVSLRDRPDLIDRQIQEMRPDLIFGHMFLWPPANGATGVADLLAMAEGWRRHGAMVLIHDGDPRGATRFPHDVSASVDLALLNYDRPVTDWRVSSIRWPYAALVQERIGDPVPEFRADLAFAGLLRDDGLYGPRTTCVRDLQERIGMRVYHPGEAGYSNRMLLADVAPSCIAMVGFGRPEVPGWIDTRVFTVPGAGGILLHDDAGGLLEPYVHYVPCERYNADSVIAALDWARHRQAVLREAAFAFVQATHTYRHRCQEVLDLVYA